MFSQFLIVAIICIAFFMIVNLIFTIFDKVKENEVKSSNDVKENNRDTYYHKDNHIHNDVFKDESINYNTVTIMPKAFVEKSEAYNDEADTQYFIKPIAKDFWRIGGNKLIKDGYLVKILNNKYVLCFGCFIDKLKYSAFNRSYAFFYTDDDCRTFDDYVKDTDTGVECRNLRAYEGQYTDGAVAVLTWDCNGNFAKKQFPFLNVNDDLKLVLLSHRNSQKQDDCVSVGIGVVLDESEIIFK